MNQDQGLSATRSAQRIAPFDRVLRVITVCEDVVLVSLLSAMIGLGVTQIILRNIFSSGLLWGDGLLRVLVLWVGMIGAVVATRQDKQITVDVLSRVLPERWRAGTRVVTDLFTGSVAVFVAWHAGRLVLIDMADGSVAFASVPVWMCELILPIAFLSIGVRYLAYAASHLRGAVTVQEGGQ